MMRRVSLVVLLVVVLGAGWAQAGKRNYVWSYDYGIGPLGGVELETWWTAKTPDTSDSSETKHEIRFEVEVPLTDRWETDFYLVFTEEPDEDLDFSDVFWSNKVLLTFPGEAPVDLMGYFELKRSTDFHDPWEFETILILSKDFDDVNLTGNVVYEGWLDSRNRDHDEIKAILSGGYAITPRFNLAGELQGVFEGSEQKYYLGPTFSFGLNEKAWIAVGPTWGLNDDADDLRVRLLFGLFL